MIEVQFGRAEDGHLEIHSGGDVWGYMIIMDIDCLKRFADACQAVFDELATQVPNVYKEAFKDG